jgi:altronate dehydratase small subunit
MSLNTNSPKKLILICDEDNVAVSLCNLNRDEEVSIYFKKNTTNLKMIDPIPLGHKIALLNIKKGTEIVKYGEIIGKATSNIRIGEHVHVHNVTDY